MKKMFNPISDSYKLLVLKISNKILFIFQLKCNDPHYVPLGLKSCGISGNHHGAMINQQTRAVGLPPMVSFNP